MMENYASFYEKFVQHWYTLFGNRKADHFPLKCINHKKPAFNNIEYVSTLVLYLIYINSMLIIYLFDHYTG